MGLINIYFMLIFHRHRQKNIQYNSVTLFQNGKKKEKKLEIYSSSVNTQEIQKVILFIQSKYMGKIKVFSPQFLYGLNCTLIL